MTRALEGRLAHAQAAAEQAVAAAIAGGLWEAWALLELAAIQLRRGHTAAGRSLDHAGELLAAARDPGRLPEGAETSRRLERARARVRAAPAELPSAAELAVLRLLPADTCRDRAALYLSPNTVKSHIRAIYRKLGVNPARTPSPAPSRSG